MSDTETSAPAPNNSFMLRAKSALIFAPFVLILLWIGGGGFALMMAVAAGIGVYEWAKMVNKDQQNAPVTLAYLAAIVTGLAVMTAHMVTNPIISLIFLLALCFLIFAYNYAQKGPKAWLLLAGVVYIGFSFQLMICIRDRPLDGLYQMMTLLFIVWASDITAYFAGRTFGGPKLAPTISPKKTWSGFIGSSIGAGAVAALMSLYPGLMHDPNASLIVRFSLAGYFIFGAILGGIGQAGDLLVSYYKRKFGVKDSGTLIPGHGGILDRVDALMLVAMVFGLVLKFVVRV